MSRSLAWQCKRTLMKQILRLTLNNQFLIFSAFKNDLQHINIEQTMLSFIWRVINYSMGTEISFSMFIFLKETLCLLEIHINAKTAWCQTLSSRNTLVTAHLTARVIVKKEIHAILVISNLYDTMLQPLIIFSFCLELSLSCETKFFLLQYQQHMPLINCLPASSKMW